MDKNGETKDEHEASHAEMRESGGEPIGRRDEKNGEEMQCGRKGTWNKTVIDMKGK